MRVFVIWEPVLASDWSAPSTASLSRIPDLRASQFWDKQRLMSHSMGEHDKQSIVWDHIAVYPIGAVWNQQPPQPLYGDGPVVRVLKPAEAALAQALNGLKNSN